MISPADVSACLVTRGDVDMAPILESLPYDDVVLWDNARAPYDAKVYGRYLATTVAKNDLIYFQDDDAVFTNHLALLDAYEPGVLTLNMDAAWVADCGYEDSGMLGFGAIGDRALVQDAFRRYGMLFDLDRWSQLYADLIVTIISPTKHIDLGRTVLPHGYDDHRMFAQPDFNESKALMKMRARHVRAQTRPQA